MSTLVWSDTSISECPGCGATVAVGIMSLCATCRFCGMYYVDVNEGRGWYFSRQHYEYGCEPVAI
jgi:hypothetical protein